MFFEYFKSNFEQVKKLFIEEKFVDQNSLISKKGVAFQPGDQCTVTGNVLLLLQTHL